MKEMKKIFKFYAAMWAVLLVLFNVIAFVSPGWEGQEKYTASFWIGYVFISLAFIGQLVCAYIALKSENNRKLFYNIPLVTISYTGLILSFICGGLCMLISSLPYWVGVILCAAVLAFTAIAVIKATMAAELVSETDEKLKVSTASMKKLTVEAESLITRADTEEAKAACKKVYEALRYSDPVSKAELAEIENEIAEKLGELKTAAGNADAEEIKQIAEDVLNLTAERNRKCRALK